MTREQTGPWNTQNRLAHSKHRRGVAALRPPVPEKRGLWRGRGCDASRAASHALLPRHRAGAAWPPARPPVPRQSHLATSHHRWCMCGPRVRGGGCFLPRVPRCRPTGPSPPQAPAACEEAPLTRRSVRTRRQLSHGLGARILMTADNRKAPASNHLARCMGRKPRGPQSGLAKCRSVRTDGGRGGMGGTGESTSDSGDDETTGPLTPALLSADPRIWQATQTRWPRWDLRLCIFRSFQGGSGQRRGLTPSSGQQSKYVSDRGLSQPFKK